MLGRILKFSVQTFYLNVIQRETRSIIPNYFFKAIIHKNILDNSTVVADVVLSEFDSIFT